MSGKVKYPTPTAMDPVQVNQRVELLVLAPGTEHSAQLTAVEYGLGLGLSPAEIKEQLLAPLGIDRRIA